MPMPPQGAPSGANGPGQPSPAPQGAPGQGGGPSPAQQAVSQIQAGYSALAKMIQAAGKGLPPQDLQLFQTASRATDAMLQSLAGPQAGGPPSPSPQAGGPPPRPMNAGPNSSPMPAGSN